MRDKQVKTFLNGFIKIVNEGKHKPNKLWTDQRRQFYNNLVQKWLDDYEVLMYATYNEGKSVNAERFIRTLTANDSKSYIGYLSTLVDEHNNVYHRSIGKNTYWCWLPCFNWRN